MKLTTNNSFEAINFVLTSVTVGLLIWIVIAIDTKSSAEFKRDMVISVILSNQDKLDYILDLTSDHMRECSLPMSGRQINGRR